MYCELRLHFQLLRLCNVQLNGARVLEVQGLCLIRLRLLIGMVAVLLYTLPVLYYIQSSSAPTIRLVFCASASVEKRHRRHAVFGVSVRVLVCASRKSCEHHISKTGEGNFAKFWSHNEIGFTDLRVRFWRQNVKGQVHSRE